MDLDALLLLVAVADVVPKPAPLAVLQLHAGRR
jgi:hypothetical protein